MVTHLPDGTTIHHQHDLAGRLTYSRYPDGTWEAWEYDRAGRLCKASNPHGETVFERDALGRIIREIQNGHTIEHCYDSRSRLTHTLSDLGVDITHSYDGAGLPESVKAIMQGMPHPWEARLQHDRLSRETLRTMTGGVACAMQYDGVGRPSRQSVTRGGHSLYNRSYRWDDDFRLSHAHDAISGRIARYFYDDFGSLAEAEYGDGARQWRNPDVMGNVYDSTDRTDRTYARGGQLREDRRWRYHYDKQDSLVLKTKRKIPPIAETPQGDRKSVFGLFASGGTSKENGREDGALTWHPGDYAYTWLSNGMLGSVTRPDGTTIHHQHDLAGRLTYSRYPDGSWEAWEYDRAGRLCKASNPHGETVFERDALGRIIREIQNGHAIEHAYDSRSRLTHTLSDLGADVSYGYDDAGLPESVKAIMQGMPHPWEARLQHDRLGRETLRTMTGGVACAMQYDGVGRPSRQSVTRGGHSLYNRSYRWDDDFLLSHAHDAISGSFVRYFYDDFGSLAEAEYGDGARQWRNPDVMGNVYDSADRTDRTYARGGQLREDRRWRYHYDKQGNLVLKTKRKISPIAESPQGNRKSVFGLFASGGTSKENGREDGALTWHPGDYAYTWLPNGMLGSVTRLDGKTVTFKYDALGRRIEKSFNGRVHRYLWDGDVILHEWEYAEADRPQPIVAENGEVSFGRPEPTDNLVTWVYDTDSYVPTAKLVGGKRYGIVSDYIGRPVQAYDEHGTLVWQADYDIYGNLLNLKGNRGFVPFRQLGQYEDEETGLYYNRFRYYDPSTGGYISQDPIRLEGNNPTLYAYVFDSNIETDWLGLDCKAKSKPQGHHPIPKFLGGNKKQIFSKLPKPIHKEFHSLLNKKQSITGCHYLIEVLKGVLHCGIDTWLVILDPRERHLTQC